MPIKSSKKRKVKKSSRTVPDGLKLEEMNRKQLLVLTKKMIAEIMVEKQERQFFMLESEKLFNLWNTGFERTKLEERKNLILEQNLEKCDKTSAESQSRLRDDQLRAFKTNETERIGQLRLKNCQKMSILRKDLWGQYQMLNESFFHKKHLYYLTPYAHYHEKRHIIKEEMASKQKIIRQVSSKIQDVDGDFSIEFEYRYKSFSKRWDNMNRFEYVIEYFKKYDESMDDLIYMGNDDILDLFHFFRTRLDNNIFCYDELRMRIIFEIGLKHKLCRTLKKYGDIYVKKSNINEVIVDESEDSDEILKESESVRRKFNENKLLLEDLHMKEILLMSATESLIHKIQTRKSEITQYQKYFREGYVEFEKVKRMKNIMQHLQNKNMNQNLEIQKTSSDTSSTSSTSLKQKRRECPITSTIGRTKMCKKSTKSNLTPSLELLEKERERLRRKLSSKLFL